MGINVWIRVRWSVVVTVLFVLNAAAGVLSLGMTTSAIAAAEQPQPAAASSGFVRCEGTRFVLDGKPFPVVGANSHYLPWGSQQEVRQVLQDAAKLRFTVVRTFVAGVRGSLDGKTKPTIWSWPGAKDSANMDLHGVYAAYWDTERGGIGFNDGPDGFERLDFVIAEAGKLGLKLNIALLDFWQYSGGSQQMRAWYGSLGNLGRSGIEPAQSGADERYSFFFTDQRTRRDYKLLAQHVLTRRNTITHVLYKDDPTIFAWDLMNEPEFANARISKDWISEMAAYVKSIDANHLLSIGSEGVLPADPLDLKEQLLIPQIDFGTFHTYPVYHHLAPDAVVALIHRKAAIAREARKPVVMQEFGYGANKPDQVRVYRTWLAAANGEDGIAGWLAWRLTSFMDNGSYPADNGEHFDFHADASPVSAVFLEAAQQAASPKMAADAAPKPRFDIPADKFANRGAGAADTRGWYLVDGTAAGGVQGAGEEIPKSNDGIPATKLAGAKGRYVQTLRDTGGFFSQSLTAGPWIDYDLRIEVPGRYQLTARVAGPDANGDTLYVQIIGPDGKAVSAGDADWYRVHASSDGKFVDRAVGGLGKFDDDGGNVEMAWDLAAGNYKVHFVAREDGVALGAFSVILAKAGVTSAAQAGNPATRPWAAQYKIKPEQTQRLTAADVVGPDGIVYPDWHYAGVPGGIPQVPTKVRLEDFGGKPDDGQDDAPALLAAAKAVSERGGGAIELTAGTYTIARPVIIPYDHVVIRGQGPDRTTLKMTYTGPNTIDFFDVRDGDTLGPDDRVEIHFNPKGIKGFKIAVGERKMYDARYAAEWGAKYSTGFRADRLKQYAPNGGPLELIASADWEDGKAGEKRIHITYDPSHTLPEGQRRQPLNEQLAAITFVGDAYQGTEWKLARDAKRGDVIVELTTAPDLKPGDAVALNAPATQRWNDLVQNACRWGDYRRYEFRVQAMNGKRVTLNQPLRIDFPIVDGSSLQKLYPIRGCGVEGFTITQPDSSLWTSGVLFTNAWECWARNIHTRKTGRHAVYVIGAKWCEIRDCDIQEAWHYGVAGTAYVGWERAYDCLMENVAVRQMRHGPLVQWSASGNVIRNSRFDGTDMQWHSGWTNENLFENCTVNAIGENGSYGCGGWASAPNDKSHGPNGPRNVVYNCDVTASRDGLWLGGMNEAWIIAYNRFRMTGEKPGIATLPFTFDLIIRGNVFSFTKPDQPALVLSDPSCVGWEIIGNQVYGGNGKLTEGPGVPEVARDNTINPANPDAPRPLPAVPSIFEWQRRRRATVAGQ